MAKKHKRKLPIGYELTPAREAVLDAGRAHYEEYVRGEIAMVLLAEEWVRLNPGTPHELPDGTPIDSKAGFGPEELVWLELAERGCPLVDDLSIPILAASIGRSEHVTQNLIRESLMLINFLPRVWQRASAGEVEVWRVRKLASECWDLTPEAIDYVDQLMALSTARHTVGGRAAVIKEARLRFMPEGATKEEKDPGSAERYVEVYFGEDADQGVGFVEARLDELDARVLQRALEAGAKAFSDLGSNAPLNTRRAWALGDIARGAHVGQAMPGAEPLFERRFDVKDPPAFLPDCACALGLHPPGRAAPREETNLYLHLSPDSLLPDSTGSTDLDGLEPKQLAISTPNSGVKGTAVPTAPRSVVRVEGPGVPKGHVLVSDVVRHWFTRPRLGPPPKINFRVVIDLNDHTQVDAYEVPDRLKERTALRDRTCVFPHCSRPAMTADCDHTVPWKADGTGGPTCSCNLAPLCRRHHRAKTHADNHIGGAYTWWNYEQLGGGEFLWFGPKGTVVHRTNNGTIELCGPQPQTGGSSTLAERLAAAQQTVKALADRIPEIDHDERQANEANLEFPKVDTTPREYSWREIYGINREELEDIQSFDLAFLRKRFFEMKGIPDPLAVPKPNYDLYENGYPETYASVTQEDGDALVELHEAHQRVCVVS